MENEWNFPTFFSLQYLQIISRLWKSFCFSSVTKIPIGSSVSQMLSVKHPGSDQLSPTSRVVAYGRFHCIALFGSGPFTFWRLHGSQDNSQGIVVNFTSIISTSLVERQYKSILKPKTDFIKFTSCNNTHSVTVSRHGVTLAWLNIKQINRRCLYIHIIKI